VNSYFLLNVHLLLPQLQPVPDEKRHFARMETVRQCCFKHGSIAHQS